MLGGKLHINFDKSYRIPEFFNAMILNIIQFHVALNLMLIKETELRMFFIKGKPSKKTMNKDIYQVWTDPTPPEESET